MSAKATRGKEKKEKSAGISEMMEKCCHGELPDCCTTMMESMMGKISKQDCTPKKEAAGFQWRKK